MCAFARIGALVLKPANVTFEQAASVPVAAITALQALRDKGRIQPGQKDFTRGGQRYDVILDNVGNHSLLEYRRVLNPQGTLVIVAGRDDGRWIGPMAAPIKASLLSPFVSQAFVMVLAELNQEDLTLLRDLMQAGNVTPVIDRRYKLSEVPAAIAYLEQGHARGKVVIDMD